MLHSNFDWEEIHPLKTGGQAEIILFKDKNDPRGRLYIGKRALNPEYANGIKYEHKLLKRILQSGFQHAVDEDSSGPGHYTSYRRYYEGIPLDEKLNEIDGDPLFFNSKENSEDNFLRFALRLANLVRILHKEHNIVHRDIKPQNILYGSYNTIALIDLGIAMKVNSRGNGEGTKFCAPEEQLIPGKLILPSHDIYSLGKLLLWALRLVPSTKNYLQPMKGFEVPEWILRNKTSQGIVKICQKCVSKNENQRPDIDDLIKKIKVSISAGNRKKKVYEICPNSSCRAITYPGNPVCYSCLTPLIYEPPSGICAGCGREIPLRKIGQHYMETHPELGMVPKGDYHPIGGTEEVYFCNICFWATKNEDRWKMHQAVCNSQDDVVTFSNFQLNNEYPAEIVKHSQENIRALIAQSQAGLKFETLEVYRSLNIHPYDHQEDTVIRALRDLNGRCIIADGVGLGKTIECGIILRELLYRELVESVLIIVPNYELQFQWLAELEDKFELGPNDVNGFNYWTHNDPPPKPKQRIIIDVHALSAKRISRSTASEISQTDFKNMGLKTTRSRTDITDIDLFLNENITWDVIIVDEAHEMGLSWKGLRWQRLYKMDPKYLFLVTATPMRRDPADLYPLIRAIDPLLAGDPETFRLNYGMKTSSVQDRNKLKALLGQVMIRHTRNDVHSFQFPRRKAITYFAKLEGLHESLYLNLKNLIKSRNSNSNKNVYKLFKRMCISISDFIEWLNSSDYNTAGINIESNFRDILNTPSILVGDIREWKSVANLGQKILKNKPMFEIDPKLDVLFKLLENYWKTGYFKQNENEEKTIFGNPDDFSNDGEKKSPVIIFAGSNRVRNQVYEAILQKFGNIRNIRGFKNNMRGPDRQKLLNEFNKGKVDVLICGNSQSRGLNLQYGNILINLELPSSPIEIEQRIGRIERLKQSKSFVFIINIMYDIPEERLRWKLYYKHLMMFQEVLEDVDLVNLFTSAEIVNKIEDLNRAIVEGIRSHYDIEESFKQLNIAIRDVKEIQDSVLRIEDDEEDIFSI